MSDVEGELGRDVVEDDGQIRRPVDLYRKEKVKTW